MSTLRTTMRHIPTDEMSSRARWYLAIASLVHGVLGVLMLVRPEDFSTPGFVGMKRTFYLLTNDNAISVWGGLYILVGVLCGIGVANRRRLWAQIGLASSVIVTGATFSTFAYAIWIGVSTGWFGLIFAAGLTAKDYIGLRDPMRNPFEDLAREVVAARSRR